MSITPNKNAGMRTKCDRCAKPLVVAPTRNANAKMAVESDGTNGGVCAECIVTGMVKGLTGRDGRDDVRAAWFSRVDADAMRLPHIQEQIRTVVRASGSALPVDSLDFDEIAANWDLPLPKSATGGMFW